VAGRIEKRLKELSLLDQPFIRDQNISIDELLKQAIAALGENIQVRRFQRFVLGEGIEKEETDFAAEVAAQMGQKAPEPVAAAPQVEEKAPEPAAQDNPPAKGKKKK
jgi:elongation factor Ts